MGVSKTNDHIKIKIRMPNPSQEPSGPTKAPTQDLKYVDVLCNFKIQREIRNAPYGCIKYPNQDQDAKSHSGASSPHQRQKSGLKGHISLLLLQSEDREQKFSLWVNQRPVTISISISG